MQLLLAVPAGHVKRLKGVCKVNCPSLHNKQNTAMMVRKCAHEFADLQRSFMVLLQQLDQTR